MSRFDFSEYIDLLSEVQPAAAAVAAAVVRRDEEEDQEAENDSYATRKQLKEAYVKFAQQKAKRRTSPPVASSCLYSGCTDKCDFFIDGPVSICYGSGKVHFCTATACSHMQTNQSEMACGLTGRVFGVRIQSGGERVKDEERDTMYYTREGAYQANTEVAVSDLFVKCEQATGLSHTPTRPPPSQSRPRGSRNIHRANSHDTTSLAIHNAVGSIITHLPQEFRARKEQLVKVCTDIWRKYIQPSRVYTQHPGKYVVLYHCLVVMNHMIDGCYLHPPKRDPVITPDSMMRRLFPDMKDLVISVNGKPKGVVLRQFTKTKKIFKRALLEAAST
jgi:hypothetical protein